MADTKKLRETDLRHIRPSRSFVVSKIKVFKCTIKLLDSLSVAECHMRRSTAEVLGFKAIFLQIFRLPLSKTKFAGNMKNSERGIWQWSELLAHESESKQAQKASLVKIGHIMVQFVPY